LHFPEDDPRASDDGGDASVSFLATLDRMHLTAIAGAEALSETRRRDALVQGLREIRRELARRLDPESDADLAEALDVRADLKSRCQKLREQQQTLVERLDTVAESLVYGDALSGLVPRVVDLVAAIRTHELDERDFLEQAEGTDIERR
jgi:hypothetical protein